MVSTRRQYAHIGLAKGTRWLDISGQRNHAAINYNVVAPKWSMGGNGLTFLPGPSNDYNQIVATQIKDYKNTHEISGTGWVTLHTTNFGSGCYFYYGHDNGGFGVGQGGASWDGGGGNLIGLSGQKAWLNSLYEMPIGKRVRVGFTYNGTTGLIYVNGNLVYSQVVDIGSQVPEVVTIGGAYTTQNEGWRYLRVSGGATINDVSIWTNRVLTPTELKTDYRFANSRFRSR